MPRTPLHPRDLLRLCLARALRRRCPQCGQAPLFARFARLRERCDACGLIYRREPGAELGSMTLIAIASELLAAALILLIWWGTDWGIWASLAVSVPIVVTASYALVPWCMALWVGVEYLTDVHNGEGWAQPRR